MTLLSKKNAIVIGIALLFLVTSTVILPRKNELVLESRQLEHVEYSTIVEKFYDKDRTDSINSNAKHVDPPGVVWLASFPNSGTSYTLEIIKKSSDFAIATNYGKEASRYLLESSLPIHPSFVDGPFRTNDRYRDIPDNYVVTKTHCGGRCIRCGPSDYLETEASFLTKCLSTTPLLDSNTNSVLSGKRTAYPKSIVKKAIHIIRNPFDNIVSRFHHAHKIHVNNSTFEALFPRNSVGFQAWCADMDSKYTHNEAAQWDERVVEASVHVPCRSEFYRYIQWHNLAFSMLERLAIPVLFIKYEDYGRHLDARLSTMLEFLELPNQNQYPSFHQGNYTHHYTMEQRIATMSMMRIQSSRMTWEKMKSYRDAIDAKQVQLESS